MPKCSSCGEQTGGKLRRCNACNQEYMRARRAKAGPPEPARLVVAVVQFEDALGFGAVVAPNAAAIKLGWVDRMYSFPTEEEALSKAEFLVEALDAWNECNAGQLEVRGPDTIQRLGLEVA